MGEGGFLRKDGRLFGKGLGIQHLDALAHGGDGVGRVVEAQRTVAHGLPDGEGGLVADRPAVVADASVEEHPCCLAPFAHGFERQAGRHTRRAMQALAEQGPALRTVAAFGNSPRSRALGEFAPVAHLEACVGFANIMEKCENRKAGTLNL